ncbi:MAG TPA: carbohydrate kinase [Chthoniobacterales bacterium]|nr:carbohydrate kinase [Chthoniobacterales bacterium]
MSTTCFAFGEIVWDLLPSGKHAGGAPFNVAVHVAQIGGSSALLSCVGRDELGDEILAVARRRSVNVDFVARARSGLPTGTVSVRIDAHGHASYAVAQPVAWDEIEVSPAALEPVRQAGALVYGSLAARSPCNLLQLERLLQVKGPLKFFDVNLRPPFSDAAQVMELARRADVVKLNDSEAAQLAAYLRTGAAAQESLRDQEAVACACETLAEATNVTRICVTRGDKGAAFWDSGKLTTTPALQVEVKDTVGAGDAFMAGLVVGLTNGTETRKVLQDAARLGAFVASQRGATPLLPAELRARFGR